MKWDRTAGQISRFTALEDEQIALLRIRDFGPADQVIILLLWDAEPIRKALKVPRDLSYFQPLFSVLETNIPLQSLLRLHYHPKY